MIFHQKGLFYNGLLGKLEITSYYNLLLPKTTTHPMGILAQTAVWVYSRGYALVSPSRMYSRQAWNLGRLPDAPLFFS